MVRLSKTLSSFLLGLSILSCSSQTEPPAYFDRPGNYRALANIENLLGPEDAKLHGCLDHSKSNCFTLHPFVELEKNHELYEEQIQKKRQFHSCVLDEAIVCAYQASNHNLINKLNHLKKSFLIDRNETYLTWTKLRDHDSKKMLDMYYDFTKIDHLLSSVEAREQYLGVSIDNRDLVAIPIGFQGMAMKEQSKVVLYCRSRIAQDFDLAKSSRSYYKSSQCNSNDTLKGQKLLLLLDNGSEVILNFNFGKFASRLEKLNESEKLDLYKARNELLELLEAQDEKEKLSLELILLSRLLIGKSLIQERSIILANSGDFKRKHEFAQKDHLNLLLKSLLDSIDNCIFHKLSHNSEEKIQLKPGLYVVKYGAFASFSPSLTKVLAGPDKIEILHPFLLNEQELKQVHQIADDSKFYERVIDKSCVAKKAVELNLNFILDEVL